MSLDNPLGPSTVTASSSSALSQTALLRGRSSGVLLHISCLPSPYGIGDMGASAYTLARRLREAGQKYWQILPLTPSNPASGESPYFSSSAFAGNPLLIDLDALVKAGWLQADEIEVPEGLPADKVDFTRVRAFKLALLNKAAARFLAQAEQTEFEEFCQQQGWWLEDFSLFTALHQREGKVSWNQWPAPLRDRDPAALETARKELAEAIRRECVLQFFFFAQWQALKDFCNELGLVVFGDMPIYVSYESADVWANRQFFKLDDDAKPITVSGVPPDYFSATGQLWNNPVYRWDALKADGYQWWIKRMGALFERFDIVRIDHFRGLVQYWEVPAGEPTAINGSWQDVPTFEFFDTLIEAFPHFPVVVEDLGIITPDVIKVKEHYGFPGMLILQFAFNEEGSHNAYLPHNHPQNALVYLGCHDNDTGNAWFHNAEEEIRQRLYPYLKAENFHLHIVDQLLEMVMESQADIAIVTAQDLLDLPGSARMNDPSTNEGNWRWRLTAEQFEALPMLRLGKMTERFGRNC